MYKSDTTDSDSENNAPPPTRRKILSKRRQKMSPLKDRITELKNEDMETDTSFEARLTPLLTAPTIPQLTDKLLSSPSENVGVKILRPVPDTENKERCKLNVFTIQIAPENLQLYFTVIVALTNLLNLRKKPKYKNFAVYRYGVGFSLTRTLYDPKKETLGWLLKTLNRHVSYVSDT